MFICSNAQLEQREHFSPRVICGISGCFCKHQDWVSYGKPKGWIQTEDARECPKFQDYSKPCVFQDSGVCYCPDWEKDFGEGCYYTANGWCPHYKPDGERRKRLRHEIRHS